MGKFSNNSQTIVRVPLSQLTEETGNVRYEYDIDEIKNLAKSIQEHGLLNPITVKPAVTDEEKGLLTHEVICGHRRLRALKELQSQGVDVGLVQCCIRTGDTWTLQMIENIQRTDLSPREKEHAIQEMLDNGKSQKEIADMLAKPISYVSDIVAGIKVRSSADKAGIDTDGISTKALSQLRSIPEEKQAEAVRELAQSGGTFREATRIMHEANGTEEPETTYVSSEQEEGIEPETTYVSTEHEESTTNVSSENIGQEESIESDPFETESPTTNVSSEAVRFSVYGCLNIGTHRQQLTLDGVYTLEDANERAQWLKKNLPGIDWLLYDEESQDCLSIQD